MEEFKSLERKEKLFDVKDSLEKISGVSEVKKVELDPTYFEWAKTTLKPEVFEVIKNNYKTLDVHSYKYLSDNLSIAGFIWTPKEIKEQLPVTIWNRGGTGKYGSTGVNIGTIFTSPACKLASQGSVVVGSEYRGGLNSEGKDEWGGRDLDDVIEVKKIADQLSVSKQGKVLVAGASRGGMMSYMLAAKEPWVKGVISLAGTTDITNDKRMESVFIDAFGNGEEERKKRSATHFYQDIPKELPILIMQGSIDERVLPESVVNLKNLLVTSGHNVEYHEFPKGDHYFYTPTSPYRKESLEIIEKFISNLPK